MEEPNKSWKKFERIRPQKKAIRKRFRKIESSSIKHAHKFIVKRWVNVREVRRHATAWMLLVILLTVSVIWQGFYFSAAYTRQIPSEGTAYSEGIVGSLDTMNPIFANSLPERSASKLLFSGLLRYDDTSNLSGDLAESWRYEDGGKRILVTLRPNIKWHDGAPMTSADVVYTIDMIKNPNVRSPLYSSWRDVAVKAIDGRTVEFTLPAVYAPFIDSLTVGILPRHILSSVQDVDLRNAPFNRAPVGSGPFVFRNIKSLNVEAGHVVLNMDAYPGYHLGKAKLGKFYIHAFSKEEDLRRSFVTDEVNAAANLSAQAISDLPRAEGAVVQDVPLYNGAYAFFRNSNEILKDVNVRKALRLAIDRPQLLKKLDNRARLLNGPLLPEQLPAEASIAAIRQPEFDLAEAAKILDQAGWLKDASGKRMKGGQRLTLNLATVRTGDYPTVAQAVADNWNKLGLDVRTQLAQGEDFQQNVISPRAYDVLIYELAIGRDPDVYAYWHSSQNGQNRLNLSEYSSGLVDDALTSARSRLESNLRGAKYKAFYQQWINDAPAVALYQPMLHYVTNSRTTAMDSGSIVDAVDRYSQVQYWSSDLTEGRKTP